MANALLVLTHLVKQYPHLERPEWSRTEGWVHMVLGQQTARTNVDHAMHNLAGRAAETLATMPVADLAALIHPVRFHDHKAVYIQNILQWYLAHGGDERDYAAIATADLRQELVAIDGVGEETADTMLLYSFNRNVFVADRYAMLLFNRLGFGPYHSYQKLRAAFMPLAEAAPYATVRDWHTAIDRYGREYRGEAEDWLLAPI